jgi:exopolysaccharide biosynthesis polyprenyl glycosylphosphotransferase
MRPTPTVANEALEVVGDLPAVERVVATRRRPELSWQLARPLVDATMLAVACFAAALGSEAAGVSAPPVASLVVFGALVMLLFALRGMYSPRIRPELLENLRGVVAATSLAAMSVLTLREVLTEPPELAAQTTRAWAFATAYVAAGRIALHWSQDQARRQGEAMRPTLIVGAGRIGRLVAKRLLAHPELGLKPIGFLDKDPLEPLDGAVTVPVLGASWDLDEIVADHEVGQVIVTFSTAPNEVLLRLVRRCEELGISVSFVPRLFEHVNGRVTIEHIGGLPLVSAHPANPRGWQFAVKYAVDRIAAAIALLLVLPIMAAAALAIWTSVGRPILFRQQRVGRDGRPFGMLKFRTMLGAPEDAGEADADWALAQTGVETPVVGVTQSADRRTPLGSMLRRFSIDELPQLLNVLKGEMSMVGPRPERVHYVGLFEESVYRYSDRHRVKAGITGWAQVNGLRGKTSLADRIEWDNYYIENWSLWLDVKIVLMTALAVVRSSRQVE